MKKLTVSALALLMAASLSACGTTKLDPTDYVNIDLKGANGYGKIEISTNYSDLRTDISDALGDDSTKKERSAATDFANSVEFEVISDNENLSNGDVVEISVNYDKDEAKEYKVAFSSDSFKYEVDDLEEAEPIDPFENLEIIFSGISSKGTAKFDSSGLDGIVKSYVTFEIDNPTDSLSNGDVITVKASADNDALLNQGYVLTSDTKEYTVEGLKEAISVDPFEGLVLEYNGIAPNVSVSFDTTGCDEYVRNNVNFSSSGYNLSNGEKFTVTASYSESKAEENGIVMTADEKEYTVEGAPYYITDPEGIDFTSIDNDFKDMAESEASSDTDYYVGGVIHGRSLFTTVDSNDEYIIKEITYTPVKTMFFNAKEASNYIKNNHLVIWEIEITAEKTGNSDGDTHDTVAVGKTASGKIYAETYVQNIAVNADGSLNLDEANSKECNVYYTNCWGAYHKNWIITDESLLTTNADTIAEQWRSKNVGDFVVTISDNEE